MLLQIGAFGQVHDLTSPEAYQTALANAWSSFCSWRKSHKISSSQKKFKYRFVFQDDYGMYMNCKGFNARCVSEWLLDVLITVRRDGVVHDERLYMTEATLKLSMYGIVKKCTQHSTKPLLHSSKNPISNIHSQSNPYQPT